VLWSKLCVRPQFVVRVFSLTSYIEWNPVWEASSRSARQNPPPAETKLLQSRFQNCRWSVSLDKWLQLTSSYSVSLRLILISVCLRASEVVSSDIPCTVCHRWKETGTKSFLWRIWGSCSCFEDYLSLLGSDTVCHSENVCPMFRRNFVLPSLGSISLIRS
jgi:hypothetical protein